MESYYIYYCIPKHLIDVDLFYDRINIEMLYMLVFIYFFFKSFILRLLLLYIQFVHVPFHFTYFQSCPGLCTVSPEKATSRNYFCRRCHRHPDLLVRSITVTVGSKSFQIWYACVRRHICFNETCLVLINYLVMQGQWFY